MHIENFWSLFVAWMVVWAVFFIYDLTVARRMAKVEKDLAQLKQQIRQD